VRSTGGAEVGNVTGKGKDVKMKDEMGKRRGKK